MQMSSFRPPYAEACEPGSSLAKRTTDIETNLAKRVTKELTREKHDEKVKKLVEKKE